MIPKRKVITIDGPSSSGKSTLADLLAKKLSFIHLNTGAIYRTVALIAIQNRCDFTDEDKLAALIRASSIIVEKNEQGEAVISLNGKVLGEELRTVEVSEATSKVSVLAKVRKQLVSIQHEAFAGFNLVAEGRDMGTVIFPDADLKFYIQVDAETRIKRRLIQMEAQRIKAGKPLSQNELNLLKEQMKIEILERDTRDSERAIAPLIPAKEAIIIDNSSATLTESLENMYAHATKRRLI
ncbi:MAG: (d)CMP kinase [bacterium]|nr:(d)CMP kinase [bacterium]